MSDTNTNTTNAKPGKFELIKNYETGFWELTTPTPKITYVLSPPTEDWVNVVYLIGLCVERYRRGNEVSVSQSIRDIVGIKQLIGGW